MPCSIRRVSWTHDAFMHKEKSEHCECEYPRRMVLHQYTAKSIPPDATMIPRCPPPSVDGDPLMHIPTMHLESQTMCVEVVVAPRIPWLVQWGTRLGEKETIERRWPHNKRDDARVRVDLASLVLSLHGPKVKSARTPTLRCHRSIRIVLSEDHTPPDGSVTNRSFLTSSFGVCVRHQIALSDGIRPCCLAHVLLHVTIRASAPPDRPSACQNLT